MYLISNRHLCSKEKYIKTIVEAAKNNVEYLILREKDLEYEGLEKLYNEIVLALKENNADINIIVNSQLNYMKTIQCMVYIFRIIYLRIC